jgi:putative ATP-binding cassette transporter
VLHQAGLDHLVSSLDRDARWDRKLSLEEQQRIAFARLLLHVPRWVFLDDALSALDASQRQAMMSVFEGAMRGTAVISTSRIPEQGQFYSRTYNLRRVPSEERLPLRARPRSPQPARRKGSGAGGDA